jgi:outer membrane immunogenic protein
LARRPPPAPAYVPAAPPPYLWSGCYVGGNIGGAWSNFEVTDVATGGTVSTSNSGFAGGGQIGCDYQWNAWVFGLRNMLDGTSLSSSGAFADTSTHWFDTLTARGGYLIAPNFLFYVQGGAAWTNTDVTFLMVPVCRLARSRITALAGQWGPAPNGCSRRTGRCSPNTILWVSEHVVRPLRLVALSIVGP